MSSAKQRANKEHSIIKVPRGRARPAVYIGNIMKWTNRKETRLMNAARERK